MQGAPRVRFNLPSGFLENLWFDSPDHQVDTVQKGTCSRLCGDAKAGVQLVAGGRKGLHYVNVRRSHALADEAANDGAGHIAAADKCDALVHETLR